MIKSGKTGPAPTSGNQFVIIIRQRALSFSVIIATNMGMYVLMVDDLERTTQTTESYDPQLRKRDGRVTIY